MSRDMYIKNAESVREICKILDYRLFGFDPNWTIFPIDEKLPKSFAEGLVNQMTGAYENIPDNFMSRIALIMGLDWEFPANDDELKMLINQCNNHVKRTEENIELQNRLIDESGCNGSLKGDIEKLKRDQEEYLSVVKTECNEKVELFRSMIQCRERLRNWKTNK